MELGRFLTAFLWGRSRQRHVVLSLQLGFTGGPESEAVFVQIVAGARNAECYTVPEVYWVDLR